MDHIGNGINEAVNAARICVATGLCTVVGLLAGSWQIAVALALTTVVFAILGVVSLQGVISDRALANRPRSTL